MKRLKGKGPHGPKTGSVVVPGGTMHGGKRAGAGRKPAKIDLVELEKLCGLQCTDKEVAGFFGVDVRTIERRRRRESAFAATMQRGRVRGCISVRRSLFQQALEGNVAALTFLSKALLSDRDVRSGEARKPRFSGTMEELLATYRDLTVNNPPAQSSGSPDRRARKHEPMNEVPNFASKKETTR